MKNVVRKTETFFLIVVAMLKQYEEEKKPKTKYKKGEEKNHRTKFMFQHQLFILHADVC